MRCKYFFLASLLGFFLTVGADAEIFKGYVYHRTSNDMAPQGRFFSTTDFDYQKGERDKYTYDRYGGWNRTIFTRGQDSKKTAKASALNLVYKKHSGLFKRREGPWISGKERTLFGVIFDHPLRDVYRGQFKQFAGKDPELDLILIKWGQNVPVKDGWNACIETKAGRILKLPVDPGKQVFANSVTSLQIEPVAVKAFYVALKGVEDGIDNPVEVRQIGCYLANRPLLDNNILIYQADSYLAYYSAKKPGTIDSIKPLNPYIDYAYNILAPGVRPNLFTELTPFIRYEEKDIYPVKLSYSFQEETEEKFDRLTYDLRYKLPHQDKELTLKVEAGFYKRVKESIEFKISGSFIDGARIGFRIYGSSRVFDKVFSAKDKHAISVDKTHIFKTPAGEVGISLAGTNKLYIDKVEDDSPFNDYDSKRRYRFQVLTDSQMLKVALSLPIGPGARPPREAESFKRYASPTAQGEEGYAPFKREDLELLDVINCGDPNDSHKCYDYTNDPLLKEEGPAKKKDRKVYAQTKERRVEIKEVRDSLTGTAVPCRVIGNTRGTYFRYDLKGNFKRGNYYLVIIEHAFDKRRIGTCYVIAHNRTNQTIGAHAILWGGFDTLTNTGKEGKVFKKESLLNYCYLPEAVRGGINADTFSICVSSGWDTEGCPIKASASGLAVKRIELYRVKRMPQVAVSKALLPKQERQIGFCTEVPKARHLYVYPKLIGYNQLWSYKLPASGYLGSHLPRLKQYDRWLIKGAFTPGSLTGHEWLLSVAEKENVFVKVHLGHLIFMSGSQAFTTGDFVCTMADELPLDPTEEELAHIVEVLNLTLPRLAKYKSLQSISICGESSPAIFSQRNLKDFSRQTNTKLEISALAMENGVNIVKGDPKLLKSLSDWACKKHFAYHKWLLAEIQKYRKDLFITLNSTWGYGNMYRYIQGLYSYRRASGIDKEGLAVYGIKNYADLTRLIYGIDSELYRGVEGFVFKIQTDSEYSRILIPDFYDEPWFENFRDCFTKGLSIWVDIGYEEGRKPFAGTACMNFKNQRNFRRNLVRALQRANARDINITAYKCPWRGRLNDFRLFCIPFRMLPFAEPEAFAGKIKDSANQAAILKYGTRYALFNAGDRPTKVVLELPPGKEKVYDLSDGILKELVTGKDAAGRICAKIPMEFWSLKTLTF